METISQSVKSEVKPKNLGCLSELGWFASGVILPIGSLSFYRSASKRPVRQAILFFFVFTFVLSVLATISTGISMFSILPMIRDADAQGKIPEITISNGIARVNDEQPIFLLNSMTDTGAILVAVDTTGELISIDQNVYDQGFLLTRQDLHVLSGGRYQTIPLAELNTMFQKDPLVINGESIARAWVYLSWIIVVVYFIILIFWNSIVRLMFIAMIALVLWGIVSMFRPKLAFGNFVIGGLYGIVPAIYLSYLLGRIGASFFGLQTILLGVFWLLALLACLVKEKFFSAEYPLRLWTALVGIPMVLFMIVDLFMPLESIYWKVALWVVALLTGTALVGLRLFFRIRDMRAVSPTEPPVVAE